MPPSPRSGSRSRGARTTCQLMAFLLMSSIGCSGCYQPAVVPPTASIPHSMVPPRLGDSRLGEPQRPLIPPPVVIEPERTPPPEVMTWKPNVPPRDWKYIVLHHTATDSGDVQSIHEAHLKNKDKSGKSWLGIGYHFVIGNGQGMNDGDIEPTFRWNEQMHGAHAGVGEYNQRGIGVVLIGNFEQHPPSSNQLRAVKQLVSALAREYGVTNDRVIGHGDVKATECPGQHFPLSEVRAAVAGLFPPGDVRNAAPFPFSRN